MARQNVQAVYENGLLRPLHPLNLKEGATVQLLITDESDEQSRRDLTDNCVLAYARARTAALTHIPTLEEVQERLSRIPGTMAEAIEEQRGEF